jgi:hypothetical protein
MAEPSLRLLRAGLVYLIDFLLAKPAAIASLYQRPFLSNYPPRI